MKTKISVGAALLLVLATVLITFSVTLTFAWTSDLTEPPETTASSEEGYSFDPDKIQSVIDRFWQSGVMGESKSDLTEELLDGFIDSTGDVYADYMSKEEYAEYIAAYQGNYVGIGVTVRYDSEDKRVIIVDVTPGSPAEEAGLLTGDVILAVDGVAVDTRVDEDVMDALGEMIRGEENTEVVLTLERNGEEISVTAVRRRVTEQTVRYALCEYNGKKVAYIAILGFDYPTVTQFKNAIDRAEAEADYIIYDLRNNGGGLLSVVCAMLTYLIPDEKLITHVKFAKYEDFHYAGDAALPEEESPTPGVPHIEVGIDGAVKYSQSYADHRVTLPSAVLINGRTASAAELFTSTLRDYKLAVTVGENTYGKGCMQTTYTFSDGSALKLTVALYNPPSDENYDVTTEGPDGIAPDVEIIFTEEENKNYFYNMPHEKDRQFVGAFNALTDGEKLPEPPAAKVN